MEIDKRFAELASDQDIDTTVQALTANGMRAVVVQGGQKAKEEVLKMIPKGAQVFTMSSTTIDTIGLAKEINESGKYDSVRATFPTLEAEERTKLGGAPQWSIGSVHAITHDGKIMVASNTGSQLGAYAYGAAHVLWVVGSQKIVKNLDEGFTRIYHYCLPLENERARKVYGTGSNVSKILIVNKEIKPERITVVIVKEKLGF